MTGAQLAHCRRQLNLSQSALAAALGLSLRTIQRYEDAPAVPQGIAWALLELKHRDDRRERNVTPSQMEAYARFASGFKGDGSIKNPGRKDIGTAK